MRQFKLWNASKTESFNFVGQGCIITEVTGLGIAFNPVIQNKAVVDFESTFEDITLQTIFGINSNPYTVYTNFANFIASNGKAKLILEYAVNNRTLFCDVWIKSIPKTQMDRFKVISEKITLARLTHWYQIEYGTVPTHPTTVSIQNTLMDDIYVNLIITGPTGYTFTINLTDGSNIVSKVWLNVVLGESVVLNIDAENKKVTYTNAGISSNGYNYIDHAQDTFIVVPKGTFSLYKTGEGTVTYSYRKWVID